VVRSLTSGEQYEYDANGNMTTRVEHAVMYQQQWDVENRLTVVTATQGSAISVTQFIYDGDGARVLQLLPDSSKTAYAGALEVTITGTQRITKTYYSAGSQLIAMRQFTTPTSSVLYFLHNDHLGSTSLTTDNNGNLVARQLYDAWGNVRLRGDLKTDIGYTSQREDVSINLMFYRARYFSPYLNRFISADTLVPDAGDPQSWNRFSYGLNNPVKYTDPTGHDVDCGIGESGCKRQSQKPGRELILQKLVAACNAGDANACQTATERAVKLWGLNMGSSNNGTILYFPSYGSEEGNYGNEAGTNPQPPHQTKIGPGAFSSPAWLVSTLRHEGVHRIQYDEERGSPLTALRYLDKQTTHLNEVEAYDTELTFAQDSGLSSLEVQQIKERRNYQYNGGDQLWEGLDDEYKRRADLGVYTRFVEDIWNYVPYPTLLPILRRQ
jgi:RHS repeat-associated protein